MLEIPTPESHSRSNPWYDDDGLPKTSIAFPWSLVPGQGQIWSLEAGRGDLELGVIDVTTSKHLLPWDWGASSGTYRVTT